MVEATFDIEGVHWFAGVEDMLADQKKDDPYPLEYLDKLMDVSFLKHPHRHIFKFSIKVDVNHDDRGIEFIQLQRLLKQAMLVRYPMTDQYGCSNFKNSSCEMLGKEVVEIFAMLFPNYVGKVLIRVSEDGENSALGCFVLYNKEVAESEPDATEPTKSD
jgi:hypothetical protein